MNELSIISRMTLAQIETVRKVEAIAKAKPQVDIETTHTIHSGIYTRTVSLQPGVMITGVLVKRTTTVIVSGRVLVYLEGEMKELEGYNVLPASANRKQIFIALEPVHITMAFATDAKTVEEAENEFTDEGTILSSRLPDSVNHIIITGE